MISREVIADIRYRSDIEDVISGYVSLRRAGSNLIGLCPFHSEKTPSFTVFTSSANFYCFGCGAGGDVISFIMKAENLDYPSAVKFLGKRVGIEVNDSDAEKSEISRSRIFEMNKQAAKFFHTKLFESENNPGLEYFMKKRNFSKAMIKHFGLGYTGDGWDALTLHLKKLGYTEEEMKSGFLSFKSAKTGKCLDYFRNKVMIPIIDLTGNVVAFGGRVLDNSKPKYINSSDTPVFKKSRNLFALNFAKNACAERLILCEGYMDVMALHSAGFTNAVATLGTAITPDHARLMKRYTKSVVISYDSDEAGQNASQKAFKLLSDVGLEARILKLDENDVKDPDEYIKKYGADRFRKLLDRTKSHFEFALDSIINRNDIRSTEGRVAAAKEAATLISGYSSSVERTIYATQVSDLLGIQSETLLRDVEKIIRSNIKKDKALMGEKIANSSVGIGDRVNPGYVRNPKAAAAEEAIIGIILCHPELIFKAKKYKSFSAESFYTDFNRRIYETILLNSSEDELFDEGIFAGSFSPDETGRIVKMKIRRMQLTDNTENTLYECIDRLIDSGNKNDVNDIEELRKLIDKKRRKTDE